MTALAVDLWQPQPGWMQGRLTHRSIRTGRTEEKSYWLPEALADQLNDVETYNSEYSIDIAPDELSELLRNQTIEACIIQSAQEFTGDTDFNNVTFVDAVLTSINLNAAIFRKVTFKRCTLIGVDFQHCSLFDTVFENCKLYDCRFQSCILHKVAFRDYQVEESDVRDVEFENCTFHNVRFASSVLQNVDLSSVHALDVIVSATCSLTNVQIADYQLGPFIEIHEMRSPSNLGQLVLKPVSRPRWATWNLAKRAIMFGWFKAAPRELVVSLLGSLAAAGSVAILALLVAGLFEVTLDARSIWGVFGAAWIIAGGLAIVAYLGQVQDRRRALRKARVFGLRSSNHPA